MRLDHFLLSPKLSDLLVDGGVNRWARGQVDASDHAPRTTSLLRFGSGLLLAGE
jgi:exodeoxyribonuclease-3